MDPAAVAHQLQRVVEAHSTLIDPTRRAAHDAELADRANIPWCWGVREKRFLRSGAPMA